MEWWTVVEENGWLSVIIGFFFVLFVIGLLRNMVKLALLLLLIGVVLVMFFDFTPDEVLQMGDKGVTVATETFQQHVKPVIQEELKDAEVTKVKENTYKIQTKSALILWEKGTNQATVTYKKQTMMLDVTFVRDILDDLTENT